MRLPRTIENRGEGCWPISEPGWSVAAKIYPFAIVEVGAEVGEGTKIESFCFVERGAVLGARVTLKPGTMIYAGVTIEDDCFIGPGVKFCNDSWPRVGKKCPEERTTIRHGASIGAGAIILPGSVIGAHSMVAAGAVVTRYGGGLSAMLYSRNHYTATNDKCVRDREECTRCNPQLDLQAIQPSTNKEKE